MEIPKEIIKTVERIKKAGFKAYLVGGCVRDFLRDKTPNDWDITTNAKPDEIINLFPKTFSNNKFGTVTVITESKDPTLKTIEITPFRIEEQYSDKRHPDKIEWAQTIEQDLKRRDFTINALALEIQNKDHKPRVIDLFNGQKDLKNRVIRTVGDPQKRFEEDALRLIRAIRFAVTLEPHIIWSIEEKTLRAIQRNAPLLKLIAQERIQEELIKIINSPNGARGIEALRRANLLHYIIPELEQGFALKQNKHHVFQVYEHNLLTLNYACQQNYSLEIRLAALFHDIAKPKTKRGEGDNATFYNHEIIGSQMAYQIMRRLRFPQKIIAKVSKLIRYHLFYYNPEEVTACSVRRLIRKVGKENISDLLKLRYCDRIGSGVPKAIPYRLRHLQYMIEKVERDPISVKMLKVSGHDVMEVLGIKPGPKVGKILNCLLALVLKNPNNNNRTFLRQEIVRLGKNMSESELNRTFNKAKEYINKIETKQEEMTKKKYWIS